MKRNNNRVIFFCVSIGILISLFVCNWFQELKESEEKKNIAAISLSEEELAEYEGVFFSMYPINNYKEADFSKYVGVDTYVEKDVIPNYFEMSECLEIVLEEGMTDKTHIFLGLSPSSIYEMPTSVNEGWDEELSKMLLPYIRNHQEVTFQIILPNPSLEYWLLLENQEIDEMLENYQRLVELVSAYENVTCYFMGAEEWLIANPANYYSYFEVNEMLSLKTILFTFCDGEFQITKDNKLNLFQNLKMLINNARENIKKYPDLSGWKCVFLGDSIFGNYQGSTSIPGVVRGLCNAEVYNFGVGGSAATEFEGNVSSFGKMVGELTEKDYLVQKIDEKLCFIIHYGLNDYFMECPITNKNNIYDTGTFEGAMRNGIKMLKEQYPEAIIIVLTPHYTSAIGEWKSRQEDYVDVILKVAEESEIICINNYENSYCWDETNCEEFLDDGIHPNEQGRMIIANSIIEAMKKETEIDKY